MLKGFCESKSVRVWLTITACVILTIFLIKYGLQGRWELFWADTALSLAGILLFNILFHKVRQDNLSYFSFLILLILHVTHLYSYTIFGVPWDHYMHFIGGATLGLIADRFFARERHWGMIQRAITITLCAMGVGAIHEIFEWLGYIYLGEGEGWLFFGEGDEGEWRNAILDMAFNFFGSSLVALTQSVRRSDD